MSIQQMNTQVKDLLEQAKALSENERILLADLLYAELSPSTEEWEAAWVEECEQRLAEHERGEVEAMNSDEVFARLKSQHNFK